MGLPNRIVRNNHPGAARLQPDSPHVISSFVGSLPVETKRAASLTGAINLIINRPAAMRSSAINRPGIINSEDSHPGIINPTGISSSAASRLRIGTNSLGMGRIAMGSPLVINSARDNHRAGNILVLVRPVKADLDSILDPVNQPGKADPDKDVPKITTAGRLHKVVGDLASHDRNQVGAEGHLHLEAGDRQQGSQGQPSRPYRSRNGLVWTRKRKLPAVRRVTGRIIGPTAARTSQRPIEISAVQAANQSINAEKRRPCRRCPALLWCPIP